MRVIFLDCDGVLNGLYRWPVGASRQWIDADVVERLNKITAATGAVIVLSSTWRRFWDVETLLKNAGVKAKVVGSTPYLPGEPRGCEIGAWLADSKEQVERFVILDDDSDMGELTQRLVQTNFEWGLQNHHIDVVIGMLT